MEVTAVDGVIATTVYDANSNVIATTDPLNHTTTYAYDALNRKCPLCRNSGPSNS
jgi:YD repeat-containing protein